MRESQLDADDRPRSMRDPEVRARRRAMLTLPHIVPLTRYTKQLRQQGAGEIPEFDPMDGGIDAQALFLFEKPGPMTTTGVSGNRTGSGFISRNNDDPTAEATFKFMHQAAIPRTQTVTWNVVPSWNGTRKVSGSELTDAAAYVRQLIELLPRLRAVVLVGKKATRAKPYLATVNFALFTSAHPSPLVRARHPERWNAIPAEWAKVREFINS